MHIIVPKVLFMADANRVVEYTHDSYYGELII